MKLVRINRKPRYLLLLLISLLIMLTSCSDVSERHAKLAEEALVTSDYKAIMANRDLEAEDAAFALLGSYMAKADFSGASEELREQRASGEKIGSRVTYELNILLPDISGLDSASVLSVYPSFEWESVSSSSYSLLLRETFYKSLSGVIESAEAPLPLRSYPVTFTLVRSGGTSMSADSEDLKEICISFFDSVEELFGDYRNGGEYKSVVIAEKLSDELASDTRYPTIIPKSKVTSVSSSDNGNYIVSLNVVNYADLLGVVSEEVYKAYQEENPEGVYAPPVDEVALALFEAGMKNTEYLPTTSDIELESESDDTEEICELLRSIIASQLETEVDEFTSRVREEMIRDTVSEPRTGVIYGKSSASNGIAFKVYTPKNYDSHFFKLYDASNGDLYMTVYVREGDTITLYLPIGAYRLRYATGEKWYGKEELFGPDGDYLKFNEVIYIKKNNTYSLTLYQTSDSNMTTKVIGYGNF